MQKAGRVHRVGQGPAVQRPINRVMPKLPVHAMQTYAIKSPVSTHTRPGTCAEARCKQYLNGWTTVLPKGHDMMAALRRAATAAIDLGDGLKRKCRVSHEDAHTVSFKFEAGQPCVEARKHRVSLERPEHYFVRGGDWRGSTGLIRKHTKPEHWVEDMAIRLDKIRPE